MYLIQAKKIKQLSKKKVDDVTSKKKIEDMNDESIHRRLVTREDTFLKVVSLAGLTADVIKFVTRALTNDDGRVFFSQTIRMIQKLYK